MDVKDYLKSIEDGKGDYSFNIPLLLIQTLTINIQNKVYLEHVIDELYPKDEERLAIVGKLNEAAEKKCLDILSSLTSASDKS